MKTIVIIEIFAITVIGGVLVYLIYTLLKGSGALKAVEKGGQLLNKALEGTETTLQYAGMGIEAGAEYMGSIINSTLIDPDSGYISNPRAQITVKSFYEKAGTTDPVNWLSPDDYRMLIRIWDYHRHNIVNFSRSFLPSEVEQYLIIMLTLNKDRYSDITPQFSF